MIDSHTHLIEVRKKAPDDWSITEAACGQAGARVMDVGVGLDDWAERQTIHRALPGLLYSLGLYPSHGSDAHWPQALSKLRALLEDHREDPRLAALGEIGLDHYHDYGPEQYPLFEAQLDLALEFDLPVIIHNREAMGPMLPLLQARAPSLRGVMHCWSAPLEFLAPVLDLGLMVSFAGNLTYPKNSELHEAAKWVPEDRLLCESDAPWLSPVPFRGKPNSPAHTVHTLRFLAQLRDRPSVDLSLALVRNFDRLFRKRAPRAGT